MEVQFKDFFVNSLKVDEWEGYEICVLGVY